MDEKHASVQVHGEILGDYTLAQMEELSVALLCVKSDRMSLASGSI
jgi:hypothetical protein